MHTLVLALLLSGAVPTPAPAEPAPAFTEEERKEAVAALKIIAEKFGDASATPPQAAQPPQKNMADVADKALEISTKYIGQAASIIEKAAPHVWAVMIRQQYAKAAGSVIGPLLWMLLIPLVTVVMRHYWPIRRTPDTVVTKDGVTTTRPHNCYDDRCLDCSSTDEKTTRIWVTLVAPGVITVFAAGVFIYALAESAMYLINPEYYAIKDLVTLLLHPGTF